MKKISLLMMLLAIPAFLMAQQQKIEFIEYKLDNGLHVILHQDNSLPVVAVNIMYHVGSKNEDPQLTGFAHFFEHLMFEGSENVERGTFFKYVNGAGGNLNAYTSFDETSYYQVLPSNQLELALWLESERLMHLKVDSIGIETQRKVVQEERKQRYENQPYGGWMADMFKLAFPDKPYSWTPIGEAQYIDKATLEEFMEFYKHFYVPNNAVMAIAGDFQIEETKELVEKYFGEIEKGTHEIYRPEEFTIEQSEAKSTTVYDNIQLPAVFKAYHVPNNTHPDYYAIMMLQKLLADGESSRLYKRLIDQEQKGNYVGAYPAIFEQAGLFITLTLANMGYSVEDIELIIDEEIAKVQAEGIDEREFKKLQNKVENEMVNTRARLNGMAVELCSNHIFFGDANHINEQTEKYMAVTKEDIQRVAKEYLVEKNSVTVYYLPKSEEIASK
jgi:zinc protease